MIKYTSTKQISIEEFKTPFARGLDKRNRWALLAQKIPWDDLAEIYGKALSKDFGRPSVNARVVIGSLIIKHKKCLADEATIEEIQENPVISNFSIFWVMQNFITIKLLNPHYLLPSANGLANKLLKR